MKRNLNMKNYGIKIPLLAAELMLPQFVMYDKNNKPLVALLDTGATMAIWCSTKKKLCECFDSSYLDDYTVYGFGGEGICEKCAHSVPCSMCNRLNLDQQSVGHTIQVYKLQKFNLGGMLFKDFSVGVQPKKHGNIDIILPITLFNGFDIYLVHEYDGIKLVLCSYSKEHTVRFYKKHGIFCMSQTLNINIDNFLSEIPDIQIIETDGSTRVLSTNDEYSSLSEEDKKLYDCAPLFWKNNFTVKEVLDKMRKR